jgi:hypothetical protein
MRRRGDPGAEGRGRFGQDLPDVAALKISGLPRRFAPRNDGAAPSQPPSSRGAAQRRRGDPGAEGRGRSGQELPVAAALRSLDCRVASLLAMTARRHRNRQLTSQERREDLSSCAPTLKSDDAIGEGLRNTVTRPSLPLF